MKNTTKTTKNETTKNTTKTPEVKPVVVDIKADSRGRMTCRVADEIVAGIQPCRTHLTVYVSKRLCLKYDTVASLLAKYKTEACVNPTFKLKEGKDPWNVKATCQALPTDAEDIVATLVRAAEAQAAKTEDDADKAKETK